jgi:hypothetical protein
VIDEGYVAVYPVGAVFPNLDPDICHVETLGSGAIGQSPMNLRRATGLQVTF